VRIAALYDVHGNVHALDAVLAELADEPVDAVVVGGDVVGGPWPAETLERLQGLPGDVRWVRGNGDRELLAQEEATAPAAVLEFVRGRVGMAYEDAPGAYWALLGPTVELRCTPYDAERVAGEIARSGYPGEWPRATRDEATAFFESLVDA
jgi:3',5'-cyclic AMP phosphodiesterase CpdA